MCVWFWVNGNDEHQPKTTFARNLEILQSERVISLSCTKSNKCIKHINGAKIAHCITFSRQIDISSSLELIRSLAFVRPFGLSIPATCSLPSSFFHRFFVAWCCSYPTILGWFWLRLDDGSSYQSLCPTFKIIRDNETAGVSFIYLLVPKKMNSPYFKCCYFGMNGNIEMG